jgi:endonuclease III
LKDFLAETFFEKGWESVDRHFRRLSSAADAIEEGRDESPEEISQALDRLASQVELFADHWVHFHTRLEALMREYNIQPEQSGPRS